MDLNLIRTFLEVCQTRHFGRAADNLHLTGSAVSARIKTLEEQLGATLFLRLHQGIELTPTAQRLIAQFRGLLSTWEHVRFLVAVEGACPPNLIVGASYGVWEGMDTGWIRRLTDTNPELRLRLEAEHSSEISRRLQQGSLDLGLTLEQLSGPEIVSRKLGELLLCLMSDGPAQTVQEALGRNYLHIDWSTSFNTQFLSLFPDYITARITASTARVAAKLLADYPGAAYLSQHIVENLRGSAAWHPVDGAPEFRIPVFATYMGWSQKKVDLESAVELLSAADIG